jgi:hypothetical protein
MELVPRGGAMVNSGSKRGKKTWDELVTAASIETDPEKVANIAEEIFAALEERERSEGNGQPQNP